SRRAVPDFATAQSGLRAGYLLACAYSPVQVSRKITVPLRYSLVRQDATAGAAGVFALAHFAAGGVVAACFSAAFFSAAFFSAAACSAASEMAALMADLS